MQSLDPAVFAGGLVALLGVIVGSFLNALVWRVHKAIKIGGGARSQCPICEHTLAWYDLIPVVSWLVLRAHCRHCQEPISSQYPIVELLTGSLWLLSYLVLSPTSAIEYLQIAVWLVALSTLIALAVYDLRWMILPDKLVAVFVGSAAVYAITVSLSGSSTTLQQLDPLLGLFSIAGLFYLIYQVSDGKWIGGGDVKLAVGIGLLLGLQGSLLALFIASLSGSIVGIFGIIFLGKTRKDVIPFGPFLIAGTVFSFLFATNLIDWYFNQLI